MERERDGVRRLKSDFKNKSNRIDFCFITCFQQSREFQYYLPLHCIHRTSFLTKTLASFSPTISLPSHKMFV